MNANEVIAALAGEGAHPNDHVNMGQSSNDVFPSAVHLAALDEATNACCPRSSGSRRALAAKATAFHDIVKAGRTHLMDAVPVTLGQEFSGYAAQVRLGARRVRNALPQVAQIPLGGTATGTGLNTHPEFAARVRAQLTRRPALDPPPRGSVRGAGQPRRARRALGRAQGLAVSLTKIANDLALMGSGPRAGIGEIFLPELQKGSSIMPGKVNPVIPEVVLQVAAQVIGNDTAITIGGMQGNFELNVRIPLIARNLLESIRLLAATARVLKEKCVDGIEANLDGLRALGRVDARRGDRAEPLHRLRQGDGDRQGGHEFRTLLREVALEQGVDEDTSIGRSTCARWRRELATVVFAGAQI